MCESLFQAIDVYDVNAIMLQVGFDFGELFQAVGVIDVNAMCFMLVLVPTSCSKQLVR
jgi:hypothetical protein